MNTKIKQAIPITILIVILIFFINYIYNHQSDFKQISLVNPLYLLFLIIISIIFSLTSGLIIKYLVELFNLRLKFKEWFGLSIITTFYNTIFPFRGGLIAKAAYLKKNHSFPFMTFISMMVGVYVITFLTASFIGLISIGLIFLKYSIFNLIVLLIFLWFFIVSSLIILFSPRFPETKYNLINKFVKVINGWHLIKNNKKIISIASLVSITQILLGALSILISYRVFNIDIGFIKALYLSSISSLGVIISITPASLGTAEAISVFSALVIDITPAQSLAVAILGRIVGMFVIFILGPIFSYILLKDIKNEKHN